MYKVAPATPTFAVITGIEVRVKGAAEVGLAAVVGVALGTAVAGCANKLKTNQPARLKSTNVAVIQRKRTQVFFFLGAGRCFGG